MLFCHLLYKGFFPKMYNDVIAKDESKARTNDSWMSLMPKTSMTM